MQRVTNGFLERATSGTSKKRILQRVSSDCEQRATSATSNEGIFATSNCNELRVILQRVTSNEWKDTPTPVQKSTRKKFHFVFIPPSKGSFLALRWKKMNLWSLQKYNRYGTEMTVFFILNQNPNYHFFPIKVTSINKMRSKDEVVTCARSIKQLKFKLNQHLKRRKQEYSTWLLRYMY